MDGPVACGSAELTEESFLRSFEGCQYANEKFKHADHIRLAWIYIRRFGVHAAETRIAASIRRFAISLGHEEKYHATITKAWLRLVYMAYCTMPITDDFSKFIGSHSWLTDKSILAAFYSKDLLSSDAARRGWVNPDLQNLPSVQASSRFAEPLCREQAVDVAEFKDVCSLFPTGVTVLARGDASGHPTGMTVSSFVSVSVDPPLVLVCVNNRSSFLSNLSPGDLYSINFLSRPQESVSDLFARDFSAFDRVAWKFGINGVPCLCDCLATVECELQNICPIGDHHLVIGLVTGSLMGSGAPLIRWQRKYRSLEQTAQTKSQGPSPLGRIPASHMSERQD